MEFYAALTMNNLGKNKEKTQNIIKGEKGKSKKDISTMVPFIKFANYMDMLPRNP